MSSPLPPETLVGVCVPWAMPSKDTDRFEARCRGDAFCTVLAYFDECFPTWRVQVGYRARDGFNAGAGRNEAARAFPLADVLVFNDADSLVPASQLVEAVRAAHAAPGPVLAYTRYRRLEPSETPRPGDWLPALSTARSRGGFASDSNGVMAISRPSFDLLGGYDPAYVGYGFEDLDFNRRAIARFGSLRRVEGELAHLWHPRVDGVPGNAIVSDEHKANEERWRLGE